jgi:hypothetical protein
MAFNRYLLKVHWSWDHTHDEFVTYDIEGTEEDLATHEATFLANPYRESSPTRIYRSDDLSLKRFEEFLERHGSGRQGRPTLVALYRVDPTIGCVVEDDGTLSFKLVKLLDFDLDGKPCATKVPHVT